MNGSTRINLSVPTKTDQVLTGLAQATGASKAAFVMQALNWYLPQLQAKLREFGKGAGDADALPEPQSRRTPHPAPTPVKLSRAERRRAERENRKR